MCEKNSNIKEIIIDAIRPEDIDRFLQVFRLNYASVIQNNKNILHNICLKPNLYSGKIEIDRWYDTNYAMETLDSLIKTGRSVILHSNKFAWNISIEKEEEDMFPAPELDPNITNEELARRCWAPMKIKPKLE